jgi:hypothetical protein
MGDTTGAAFHCWTFEFNSFDWLDLHGWSVIEHDELVKL